MSFIGYRAILWSVRSRLLRPRLLIVLLVLSSLSPGAVAADGALEDEISALINKLAEVEGAEASLISSLAALRAQADVVLGLEEAKAAMSAALSAVSVYGGKDVVKTEFEALRDAVATAQAAMPEAFVVYLSGQLAALLDPESPYFATPTRGAYLTLLSAIEARELRLHPVASTTRNVSELNSLLEGDTPVTSGDVVIEGMDTLLGTLLAVESRGFFTSLNRRVRELTALLKQADTQKHLRVSELTELAGLKVQVDAILQNELTTGVHVFSARYGVLSGAGATCDATAFVAKRCEAQARCTLPAKPETAICGHDPAPLAQSKNKGLVVSYACITAFAATWATLQNNRSLPGGRTPSIATLRTTDDAIVCDPTE